jgi:hypothetical protein
MIGTFADDHTGIELFPTTGIPDHEAITFIIGEAVFFVCLFVVAPGNYGNVITSPDSIAAAFVFAAITIENSNGISRSNISALDVNIELGRNYDSSIFAGIICEIPACWRLIVIGCIGRKGTDNRPISKAGSIQTANSSRSIPYSAASRRCLV